MTHAYVHTHFDLLLNMLEKKGWKPVEELFTPLNWFFCAVSNSCLVDKDLPAGTLEEETIELVSTLKLLEKIYGEISLPTWL